MSGEGREKALCEAFLSLKREHVECEDGWYSCPLVEGYWGPDSRFGCTCGAGHHNARIDAFIKDFGLEEWI